MSITQADQQFLPLDSSIKTESIPEYSTSLGFRSDSMCGDESEVFVLASKIAELQKKYIEMEKKYTRKIKELKEQLVEKHQVQSSLNQQLSSLAKEYEQHKSEIQKISSQIRKEFQGAVEREQKQTKLKSVSPKNHTNASPKRLIKKSLEMAKKDIIQPKKQLVSKDISASHQINISSNTQRSDKKFAASTELTHQQKKALVVQEDNSKASHENSLNSSNPILKNGRKPLYSPTNQTNGPSPKKKLLFNSSKQLDLFSKPLPEKKLHIVTNGSPARRINISPTHKKKQNIFLDNKIASQKQIKTDLPVIQQRPLKVQTKEIDAKKLNNSGTTQQPSSPAHRKKAASPQAIGFLRKKISNKNLTIKTDFTDELKAPKITEENTKNDPIKVKEKVEIKQDKKQTKEVKPDLKQSTKGQSKPQIQKKLNKSPAQSTKNIKMSPESKFSPARKLLRNSPTHKKTEPSTATTQKPKLFTNMRQKFDDNVFK